MILEGKKAIFFDLDGTLIDSAPDLASAVNAMLESLNLEKSSETTIRGWVGNGALTLVKRALSKGALTDESLDEKYVKQALKIFLDYYEENLCVNTVLYDGVKQTLEELYVQGYTLVIITNKPFKFIEPILKELKIFDIFTHFVGGDTFELKKPDAYPLVYMCEQLLLKSEEVVMIGDSKNDILAARAANMQSIALTYGYNYGEDISQYNPTFVVDSFEKILKILK